ncbi:MAG: hypothetical protein BAJATHORv1_10403 [Candidatus Thorarchaeota archaeon]|nr:MAG: hypothetical protein BAJATHORv1_10403 [Candidatus Thorarchaeota archaeon]
MRVNFTFFIDTWIEEIDHLENLVCSSIYRQKFIFGKMSKYL